MGRPKTISLKITSVNDIPSLLSFSDTNQLHRRSHAWDAVNPQAHIVVEIVLVLWFGASHVASPVMRIIRSIAWRYGMDPFFRSPIFSKGNWQYISHIILTSVPPFLISIARTIHRTSIYPHWGRSPPITLRKHMHRTQECISDLNRNLSLYHPMEYLIDQCVGVIALGHPINLLWISSVLNSFQQASRTHKLYSHSRCWITSVWTS